MRVLQTCSFKVFKINCWACDSGNGNGEKLEKLLQNANSQAAAAASADFADRARAQRPIQQKENYAAERIIERANIERANSGAAADSAAPSQNPPQMKPGISVSVRPKPSTSLPGRRASASASQYAKRADGKAPEMAQIHVSVAKLSAAQLVEDEAVEPLFA
jgi:hypothetical protein